MKEKTAIFLFIVGCVFVLTAIALKHFEIVKDYTLVFIGIIIESFSILIYAYQKIKKSK